MRGSLPHSSNRPLRLPYRSAKLITCRQPEVRIAPSTCYTSFSHRLPGGRHGGFKLRPTPARHRGGPRCCEGVAPLSTGNDNREFATYGRDFRVAEVPYLLPPQQGGIHVPRPPSSNHTGPLPSSVKHYCRAGPRGGGIRPVMTSAAPGLQSRSGSIPRSVVPSH